MFAGNIKVLGGPHVARGQDIAHACPNTFYIFKNYFVCDLQSSFDSYNCEVCR